MAELSVFAASSSYSSSIVRLLWVMVRHDMFGNNKLNKHSQATGEEWGVDTSTVEGVRITHLEPPHWRRHFALAALQQANFFKLKAHSTTFLNIFQWCGIYL